MRTETQRRGKKPFFNIGPGLIVALVFVAAFLAVRFLTPAEPGPSLSSSGPIVERPVVSSGQESLGPVPEVKFILDHADDFKLSSSQIAGLVSLQADWERIYGPKMEEADRLAKSVDSYLAEKKSGRSAPVAQIEGEAAPFVSLSREIAAGRRQYWARATGLLTQAQRAQVTRLRKADYAKKREALSRIVEQGSL